MEILVIAIVCAFIGGYILGTDNRGGTGALLGLFLGPIGVIIALIMRSSKKADAAKKQAADISRIAQATTPVERNAADEKECPFCAETIKKKAKVCRYCGRDLDSEAD